MKRLHTPRGFSTLEMLIAMTVLVLAISAVLMLFPGFQSGSVDTQLSAEALSIAQKMLENEQALARKDFKLVVATSSSETLDGITYQKTIDAQSTDYFTKKITATVSWGGMYNRNQKVALSTLVTNFENVVGGDTCDSILSGNWALPISSNTLFGGMSGLNDSAGSYPLTDIEVYRKRLYATVNVNASPLPSVGPNNAGTVAIDTSVGTATWTNGANARVSDNQYATTNLSSGQVSQYLKATNFGFSIPSGATIIGIQVDVERKSSSNVNTIKDSAVRIVRSDGSMGSSNKGHATSWGTSDAYDTYGSSGDLWGETGLSAASVNSSNFGVAFAASANAGSGNRTASVDNIRVTVTYTKQFYVASVSGSPSFLGGLGENSVSTGMNAVAVATSTATGSYAYVALNSATSQFQVIDVAPLVPVVVSTYQVPGAAAVANAIFYKDGYVYLGLANNTSGAELVIVDVHSPASLPAPIGTYEVGAGVNAIYVKNGYAYLATDDANRELIVLNIQDLAHPTLRGVYNAPGSSGSGQGRAVYTTGDTLYLGRYYSLTAAPEFAVLDTTPASPSLTGSYDMGPSSAAPFSVYGVIVRGILAFVLTSSQSNGGKLQILNVSNPSAPTAGASVSLPNSGGGVALDCESNTLYAASVPITGVNAGKGSLSIITAP